MKLTLKSMQQFKITPEGLTELRKKALIRSLPTVLIAVAVSIIIRTINSNNTIDDITITLIPICFLILILGFSLYLGLRRQRKLLESYVLTFENNTITRQQVNIPTITIDFSDIAQILKSTNGTFTIKSKNPRDIIGVPVQIENYNELEHLLNDIMLITEKRETFIEKYRIILSILFFGVFMTVNVVQNKFIVAAAGIVSIAILIWSLLEIQRNKNIDNKTKRNNWVVLIVVASILGTVIVKLTS